MRVFLDTNVLVSAFTTRGLCADLLRVVLTEHELVVGDVVLDELKRVLRARFGVPAERVDEVEVFLRTFTVVAAPRARSLTRRVRDPADGAVLTSAELAGADLLVTGDNDLLTADLSSVVRIVTPRAFWDQLRRGPTR
ncbi:MAG: putative toxin-antitoxin system toxin component, PIN family [Vicinamibacterales bacterium]